MRLCGNKPTERYAIEDWIAIKEIAYGWDNVRVIAHNARFDAAILVGFYNIYPKQITADTMLMSKEPYQLWDGHSLDNVTRESRERYNQCAYAETGHQTMWGKNRKTYLTRWNKGDEVVVMQTAKLFDFTEAGVWRLCRLRSLTWT